MNPSVQISLEVLFILRGRPSFMETTLEHWLSWMGKISRQGYCKRGNICEGVNLVLFMIVHLSR